MSRGRKAGPVDDVAADVPGTPPRPTGRERGPRPRGGPGGDGGEPSLRAALVVGILAGFLSGLFGVGGGILIVPGLALVVGMDQRRAHGTSLAAIFPIAIAGTAGFAVDDSVDWAMAGVLAGGALVGTVVGTAALRRIRAAPLRLIFAGTLVVAAVRLLVDVPVGTGRSDLDAAFMLAVAGLGLLAGFSAGLLGVGGGIVMVPGQTLLFAVSAAVAKGTSLAVIVPTSLVGTLRNARFGNVDMRLAAVVGLSGVTSSFLAAQLSLRLSPTLSSVLFALLLVVTAARMVYRHVRPARVREGTARRD